MWWLNNIGREAQNDEPCSIYWGIKINMDKKAESKWQDFIKFFIKSDKLVWCST